MANLPETSSFDAGVYQIETVDPVQGGATGVTNTPLKNLVNRTRWLYDQISSILSTIAGLATTNSPALTGTPTAPTPAAGDNTTKIATTAFVDTAMFGVASVNVAGGANVTLTAAQYGAGLIVLTGAITANINVIFPVNGKWVVTNSTTGAFSITCKTAAGTGVAVTQGKVLPVQADGTNVVRSHTDFAAADLTGATAPTAAQFDNTTAPATTAFVQRALGNDSGIILPSVTTTLTAAHAGMAVLGASATAINVTLPAASAVAVGTRIEFLNCNAGSMSVLRAGTDNLNTGNNHTSIVLGVGDTLTAVSNGVNAWYIVGGAGQLVDSAAFGASLASSGYQKLPSGLIIQWGAVGSVPAGGSSTVTFPITFPSAVLGMWANANDASANTTYRCNATVTSVSAGAIWNSFGTILNSAAWIAIGK